jgi:thioredoxin 1
MWFDKIGLSGYYVFCSENYRYFDHLGIKQKSILSKISFDLCVFHKNRGESTMAAPVEVTDATFEQMVVESDTPVLVDFWAEWCGPCKMIAPVLNEIANEMDGKLTIGKLDIDVNQQTAMAFGVMSIPTLLLFKDGQPVDRIVGYQPKPQLMARLKSKLETATSS